MADFIQFVILVFLGVFAWNLIVSLVNKGKRSCSICGAKVVGISYVGSKTAVLCENGHKDFRGPGE